MPVSQDALLPQSWRQEDFSCAYVFALAAAAGVAWDIPRRDVNSRDVRFYARDTADEDGPELRVQLKCTIDGLSESQQHPGRWRFQIKASNHRELVMPRAHPPRLLVVVRCPRDDAQWVDVSPQALMIRGEAWWVSLRGDDALPGDQQSKVVSLPKAGVRRVRPACEHAFVSVTLPDQALEEIDPAATAAYLRLRGWDRVRTGEPEIAGSFARGRGIATSRCRTRSSRRPIGC